MVTEVLIFMGAALAILLTLLGVYGFDMESRMLIFTPIITIATGVFALAVYRNVICKLQDIRQQWQGLWTRLDWDMGAMTHTFVVEVLFQRKLYRDDRLRWARHIFIYWGFVGLWIFDIVFFFATKILQISPQAPFHLFLDFGLDLYGGILFVGLVVALVRAFIVRGSEASIYNDTPAVFLFFVVTATGFLIEALRLVIGPVEPYMAWSFIGWWLAGLIRGLNWSWAAWYEGMWIFHAIIASVSIAYIPLSRMVHVIAVPVGRLLESQEGILRAKIRAIGHGLMGR